MFSSTTSPNLPAVEIVKFTKYGGPLSKEIGQSADGKLDPRSRDGLLVSGFVERLRPASPHDLATLIGSCKFNEALGVGALLTGFPDKVELTTLARLARDPDSGAITRSTGNITYRRGEPALALLDIDVKGMPLDVQTRVETAGGAWAALKSVMPELADTALVIRKSTSSNIYNAETGEEYEGSGGLHVYVYVVDGADVERFLTTFLQRMWLAGYGWMIAAGDGKLLIRGLIDASVASPERLVFEGAPDVLAPLKQRPRVPEVQEGGLLNTRKACQNLTGVELDKFKTLEAAERQRLKPQSDAARAAHVGKRVKAIVVKHGCSKIAATRIAEAEVNGILLPWHELQFDDPALAGATVADVLSDPDRYVDETLADPIEGPTYKCGAKVLRRRDGSVWINSFAHGGRQYDLKYDADAITKAVAGAPVADTVETLVRMLLLAHVESDEEQELVILASQLSVIGVQAIKTRIKAARKDADRKFRLEQREREDANRSDSRKRLPVPDPTAERVPVMRDLDTVLCAADAPIPVMRDLDGNPVTVTLRQSYSLHALTSAGVNGGEDAEKRLPPPKQHLMTRYTAITLEHEIERHIQYVHETEESVVPKALPGIFVSNYMEYAESELPQLAGVVTNPLVLADGTLLATNGLDRERKLLFLIEPAMFASIPKPCDVNDAAVREAMQFLTDDWLCDVQTSYEGKCILIAMGLSILQRPLFPKRPAFLVTAGKRGGGKTTAVGMVVAASTGAMPAATAWSNDENERRKAIMAAYLEGPACVVWDNLQRGDSISSPTVDKMLTSETYTDRLLGGNTQATVSTAGVMIFTGNNVSASGDMISRSLECRLETDQPNPENREFRHLDPEGWTLDNRHKLLNALYTILLGNPQITCPTEQAKTRFKIWLKSVGAAVEHAASLVGERVGFSECFMEGDAGDAETQSLGSALNALAMAAPPDGHFTAGDVKALLERGDLDTVDTVDKDREECATTIRGYFAADGKRSSGEMNPVQIGVKLKGMLGNAVRYGDCILVLKKQPDSHTKVNKYRVDRKWSDALADMMG